MNKQKLAEKKAVAFLFGEGSDEYLDLYLHFPSESYSENRKYFKRLFNSGDPDLRLAAWNALRFSVWGLPDREDYSDEEWSFLMERYDSLNNDVDFFTHNENAPFSTDRLILRPARLNYDEDIAVLRKHLKEDGDFPMYAGKKPTNRNINCIDLLRPYRFSVYEKASGKMIGMVGLNEVDETRRIATAAWGIFKPYRGKGYAKEAITALANRAFSGKLCEIRETAWKDKYRRHYVKIDMIRANIREKNIPSQKTAESCGFVYQYTDHRHYVIEGEGFEDGKIYELTPETWKR